LNTKRKAEKGHFNSMQSQRSSSQPSLPFLLKIGGILSLLSLTVIVVACSGQSSQYVPATPAPILTIVFGQSDASPTPTLLPFYCGGWATDTSPGYSAKGMVTVYGKFTQTVSGNPVGVANASVVATVLWPDGSTETEKTTTSGDGLAVFTIPMQTSFLNHLVQVQMTFSSPTGYTCSIPQAAFFTLLLVSATPSTSPTHTCHRRRCGTPTVTPTVTHKPGN
jgi:hypothetical protein